MHLADGFDDDALKGAAPAGMNGGDGALFRIDQENRDAVGGLNSQEKPWTVCDGGVPSARFGGCGVEKVDDVGMELFERNEFEVRCAEGRLEAAAILEDVFFAVPFGETEIENFFAVQEADAARASAEAVEEPGKFCERGHLQDLDAADFAFDPVRRGSGGRDRRECLRNLGAFAGLASGR